MKEVRFYNFMYSDFKNYVLTASEQQCVAEIAAALVLKRTKAAYINDRVYEVQVHTALSSIPRWDRYMYVCHAVIAFTHLRYSDLLDNDREDGDLFDSLRYGLFLLLHHSKDSQGPISKSPRSYMMVEKIRYFAELAPRMS